MWSEFTGGRDVQGDVVFLQILILFSRLFPPTFFSLPPVEPGDGRRGGMCCPIARGLDSFSEFVVS